MNNMYYLLNMSLSGVKGIEKEVRLDFYKKTIDKSFDPAKYRVKAIYGENGAGKSGIITAVKIFKDIVMHDQYLNESKNQHFLDEIINKKTQKFDFQCEYLIDLGDDKIVNSYAIQLARGDSGKYEIKQESLKVRSGNYQNSKYKTIYECKDGNLLVVKCGKKERSIIEKSMTNLLNYNTFLSLYIRNYKKFKYKDDEITLHSVSLFVLALMIRVYLDEEDQHELYLMRKELGEDELAGDEMILRTNWGAALVNSYSGLSERKVKKEHFDEYEKRVEQLTRFIRLFKKDLVSIDIDKKENKEFYECELNLNYGDYAINREFESTGIKKLIRLYDCFAAADSGAIVFVDEMDSNLNDVYLCKLIEYFMYYGNGQLCFTTHNLDPMTVLKENKNSIDFLSSDNKLVQWTSRGNATPDNCYKNGMIEYSPFNIDASDFIGMFGE